MTQQTVPESSTEQAARRSPCWRIRVLVVACCAWYASLLSAWLVVFGPVAGGDPNWWVLLALAVVAVGVCGSLAGLALAWYGRYFGRRTGVPAGRLLRDPGVVGLALWPAWVPSLLLMWFFSYNPEARWPAMLLALALPLPVLLRRAQVMLRRRMVPRTLRAVRGVLGEGSRCHECGLMVSEQDRSMPPQPAAAWIVPFAAVLVVLVGAAALVIRLLLGDGPGRMLSWSAPGTLLAAAPVYLGSVIVWFVARWLTLMPVRMRALRRRAGGRCVYCGHQLAPPGDLGLSERCSVP